MPAKEFYTTYNTLPIAQLQMQQLLVAVHAYLFYSELLPPA